MIGAVSVATTIAEAAGRICRPVEPALLGGTERPTFRRADFRLRWMATRLHTFVFVIDLSAAAAVDVVALAEESRAWARDHKGGLPSGMQTGSAAMPILVVRKVGHLRDWAESPQPLKWAAPLFPIVVSDSGLEVAYRMQSQRTGIVYEPFLRDMASQLVTPTPPGSI
jgi:hypothetical protein